MRITYTADGNDEPKVWTFDPGRIRESRGEMIERRYAKLIGEKQVAFEQWRMDVLQGKSSARRVLLWHLQDLDHPGKVRVEDVDPFRDQLLVEATKAELAEMRAVLENVGGMDETQRELMLAAIDAQIETAPDDDGGKAPSPTSGGATG